MKSLCLLTGLIYFFYLLRDSTCPIAPIRSDALESVSKDCKLNLDDTGICDLTDKQVQSILDYSKYHQVSRNKNGACVLNDNDDIAMLGWQMKKSVNILKLLFYRNLLHRIYVPIWELNQ